MGTYASALGLQPNKLARFWNDLRYIRGGGVDILVHGDSLTRGLGCANPDTESWTAMLRRLLQNEWNPDGVPGGAGFLPGKWTWSNGSGGTSNPSHPMTRNATMAFDDRIMSGAGHYLGRMNQGSGASIVWTGTDVTDLEAVHQQDGGGAMTAGWAITGTASSSGTIPSGVAGGVTSYGVHTLAGTSLSAAGTYTWTLSPPATASRDVRLSGLIRYNGDYGAGIRVHNLGCSGIMLYDPSNNLGYYRADDLPGTGTNTNAFFEANLDRFSSSAFGSSTSALGAVRAGLVICALGTNDEGTYGGSDQLVMPCRDIFIDRGQKYIDRVRARTSSPSVLFVHLPTPTNRQSRMQTAIRDSMQYLASRNEDVAFADLDAFYGRVPRASMPTGFDSGDGLHWTASANAEFGRVLASALIESRQELGV